MNTTPAAYWISRLQLAHHPEGGWFAETYRSPGSIPADALPSGFGGARSYCTAIHFLLERGDFSALHRLRSDETWHFYDGAPLTVHVISPEGAYSSILLGRDPEQLQRFQATVPAGSWFGAETAGAYSLVGCTVAPGFDFSDFELARRSELTKQFPQHSALINALTRVAP